MSQSPNKRKGVVAIARRTFLVSAGVVGGGLLVGAGVVGWRLKDIADYQWAAGEGETSFGAWLKVGRDNVVEIACPHQDMGQGVYALAALIIGEELNLPPELTRVTQAPIHAAYANPAMLMDGLPFEGDGVLGSAAYWTFDKILRAIGFQATGGSASARNMVEPLRQAAASFRDLMLRAAAQDWGAPVKQLRTSAGGVLGADGKRASFAELAAKAARMTPREIQIEAIGPRGLIGKGQPRLDVPAKTTGQARYGIDARPPGLLFAVIRHAPRLGGKLKSARLEHEIPGVKGLVEGPDYLAIVATTTGIALKAMADARIEWDDSAASTLSNGDIVAQYRAALDKGEGYNSRLTQESAGDPSKAAGKAIKATYQAPFLAHGALEPLNATVLVEDEGAKVWAGNQSPQLARMMAARGCGLPADKIEIITPYLGGAFGRRADMDFVAKAAAIAAKFKGTPVQTIWTREEDFRNDFYRPAAMVDIEAKIGSSGLPASFLYRIASASILDQYLTRAFPAAKGGYLVDRGGVDGAVGLAYGLPNRAIESLTVSAGPPVGFWRSVSFSLNCFFIESFIDELAAAAGAKPLEYRMRLLAVSDNVEAAKRAQRILERLARFDAANPTAPARAGGKIGRGFALCAANHSHIGEIADIEIVNGSIFVRRVHVALDCGFAIDPPNIAAQVRSGVNFGISAALYGRLDLDKGLIAQKNFDSYPLLALADAPEISVDLVNSGVDLGGVGEIGTPAIAPAIGNAIFAATGRRLRTLPFAI